MPAETSSAANDAGGQQLPFCSVFNVSEVGSECAGAIVGLGSRSARTARRAGTTATLTVELPAPRRPWSPIAG